MSETKHTPGPWGKGLGTAIYAKDNHQSIQIVNACFGFTTEQGEANANLISAAPELLETCEEIMKILKGTSDLIKLGDTIYGIRYHIEEVIAKAKGL